jgi:hypothetical protein
VVSFSQRGLVANQPCFVSSRQPGSGSPALVATERMTESLHERYADPNERPNARFAAGSSQ